MKKKVVSSHEKPLSLAPVTFENALAAALETPPERKKAQKRVACHLPSKKRAANK